MKITVTNIVFSNLAQLITEWPHTNILQNKIFLTIIIWEFEPGGKNIYCRFRENIWVLTCGQHRQITNIFLSMELKVICEFINCHHFSSAGSSIKKGLRECVTRFCIVNSIWAPDQVNTFSNMVSISLRFSSANLDKFDSLAGSQAGHKVIRVIRILGLV